MRQAAAWLPMLWGTANQLTRMVLQDICNCSSVNCLRSRRGLLPTAQLASEAHREGYLSVSPVP